MTVRNKGQSFLPPDFTDDITIFSRTSDGRYTGKVACGCKFRVNEIYSQGIREEKCSNSFARIGTENVVFPGDIIVKGRAGGNFKKEFNGEDILEKYPNQSFRVKTVSFCENHILVKG